VWNSTTATNGTPATEQHFVYDGWNLIAVLDGGNSLLESLVWGADLTGTVNGSPRESGTSLTGGAGGVGGLVSFAIYTGAAAGVYLPTFDGNGNVMALVNAANGASVAQYEYDTFGNLVQATGPMATANNILFSSKYFDWETGLYYYGYRYYNANTGRWLNRDPLEEKGGVNLYGFAENDAIDLVDLYGLDPTADLMYWENQLNVIQDKLEAAAKFLQNPSSVQEQQLARIEFQQLLRDQRLAKSAIEAARDAIKLARLAEAERLANLARAARAARLARVGGAVGCGAAIGVTTGIFVGNLTPFEGGGTINGAVQDNFQWYWDWVYDISPDGTHYGPSQNPPSFPYPTTMQMF
jgi:RHS repeat-associated protein